MKKFHIALTGHRPAKLDGYDITRPYYDRLRAALTNIVKNELCIHPDHKLVLHSGMALGADTIWAQVIVALREKHPKRIEFVAEVPVMTQSDRWFVEADRDRWHQLVEAADTVNVYAKQYSPACLWARNEGMVDAADLLIAVWNGQSGPRAGGTAGAVAYAHRHDVPVLVLPPWQFRH